MELQNKALSRHSSQPLLVLKTSIERPRAPIGLTKLKTPQTGTLDTSRVTRVAFSRYH